MINKLRIITNNFIKKNKDNPETLKKYELIQKILKDDNCFLKMEITYAYAILRDLEIEEEKIKLVYEELIDYKGKIDESI